MLITRDMVVAIPSGIAIPQNQIAYYQWMVQPLVEHRIEIGDNENARFTLYKKTYVRFLHFLYRIGVENPFLLNSSEFTTEEKTEPFLESDLFNDMSEKNQENMSELLQKILQGTARVQALSHGINAPDVSTEHLEEYTRRKRNLDKRNAELEKFCKAKSAPITEELMPISEARYANWWNSDTDGFFEMLMRETYNLPREAIAKSAA